MTPSRPAPDPRECVLRAIDEIDQILTLASNPRNDVRINLENARDNLRFAIDGMIADRSWDRPRQPQEAPAQPVAAE